MRHLIIYVPGLGDDYDWVRRFFLIFWRIYGVKAQLVSMQWYDGESYDEKYARVKAAIEAGEKQGYTVSIIGESAGASMAMNIFSRTPSLHKMISLCGVNLSSAPVSPHIFARSPAFKQAVSSLTASKDQAVSNRAADILVVVGFVDTKVPPLKNRITGVGQRKVFGFGHIPTILLCLSVYSFMLIREIKR
jgi:hypothetical protein